MRYITDDGKIDRRAMFNDVWAGFERQNWNVSFKLDNNSDELDRWDEEWEHWLTPEFRTECAYRGENGTKCGIGHLIPDDKYEDVFEGAAIHFYSLDAKLREPRFVRLFEAIFGEFPNLDDDDDHFLTRLQEAHDETLQTVLFENDDLPFSKRVEKARAALKDAMVSLADAFGLTTP